MKLQTSKNEKLSKLYNEELRRLRLEAHIDSKDIANFLGVSPAWYSKMESGHLCINQVTYDKIKNFVGSADTTFLKLQEELYQKAFREGFVKGQSCVVSPDKTTYQDAFNDGFAKGEQFGFAKAQEMFISMINKTKYQN